MTGDPSRLSGDPPGGDASGDPAQKDASISDGNAAAGLDRFHGLTAFSAGLFNARHRRILELAGHRLRLGWPRRGAALPASNHQDGEPDSAKARPPEGVAIWGRRPVSWRGRLVARLAGAPLVTVEDGFLRSILPGVTGAPPLSLIVDDLGVHYDCSAPSRLEALILEGETDPDASELMRRLREAGLSKYSPISREEATPPEPGYVLLIDQTRGDSSIPGAGADAASFATMLAAARAENPGQRLIIRAHPDCAHSPKRGHLSELPLRPGETLLTQPMNPWPLIEGAARVYTVSSQMGAEALMAGRPVTCFGMPFYAGWGLTDDRVPAPPRRQRRSLDQVFTAAWIRYPLYYDPYEDRLTDLAGTIETLTTLLRHRAASPRRVVLHGFRSWKRPHMRRFAEPDTEMRFVDDPEKALSEARRRDADLWLWASKSTGLFDRARAEGLQVANVEDGFLRSNGLGAALVDAASLVFDDAGIYYDARGPSRLEALIAHASALGPEAPEIRRAKALGDNLRQSGVTKYNLGAAHGIAPRPDREIILVAGQVEDDASIRSATGDIATNGALLAAARAAHPEGFLIYKPHPDVEAGLRPGGIDARGTADHIASDAAPVPLIALADRVWTMTSLIGFEALLRGTPVTCAGLPFYAGWGLTDDLMPCPRRTARPTLDALIWAALIAYPRHVDPVSHLPCEPERIVQRLAEGRAATPPRYRRQLAKLQGWCAGRGLTFWR